MQPHQLKVGVLLELSDHLTLSPISPAVRPCLLDALRLLERIRNVLGESIGRLLFVLLMKVGSSTKAEEGGHVMHSLRAFAIPRRVQGGGQVALY